MEQTNYIHMKGIQLTELLARSYLVLSCLNTGILGYLLKYLLTLNNFMLELASFRVVTFTFFLL